MEMQKIEEFKKQVLSKAKIGVLMGGPSAEREISLKSAKSVIDVLKEMQLNVCPIDILTDDVDENKNLIKSFEIDCCFIALHGNFGEDGKIQAILDDLNIPYTCSDAKASKLAMDKVSSHEIFSKVGLKVPRFSVILKKDFFNNKNPLIEFDFPWVIKPATQGSSIGLSIIEDKKHLEAALNQAFEYDEKVIIEEYIKARELTVGVLDEDALAVIEIVTKNKFFDYQAKYQTGFTEYIVPAKLDDSTTAACQEIALKAHKALGCSGCSRVDMLLTQDKKIYILELNNIPGLTNMSLLPKAAKVCGIDFGQLCLILLKLAYEKRKK